MNKRITQLGRLVAGTLIATGAVFAQQPNHIPDLAPGYKDTHWHVEFTNLVVVARDAKTATAIFDIAWGTMDYGRFSWRHGVNHDAAWVFFKVRANDKSPWQHVRLAADRALNPTGYGQRKIEPAPATVSVRMDTPPPRREGRSESQPELFMPLQMGTVQAADTALEFVVPDGDDGFTGVFLRRAQDGHGRSLARQVTVLLDASSVKGIADLSKAQVYPLGVPMVYVAEGPFYLGGVGSEVGAFYQWTDGTQQTQPYRVTGPGAIPTGRKPGSLWMRRYGGQFVDGGEISATFPNGYAAFYCMKTHIYPELYAAFMNMLTPEQAEARYNPEVVERLGQAPNWTYSGNYVSGRLGPGCKGLSWADGAAWAAWAGLRPMTELELEKVVRGFREARPEEVGESFWNIAGYGTWDWDSFKGHNNSSERPVSAGHPAGLKFKGTHGRGTLDLPLDWPQADAVGAGLRCCWYSPGKGLDLPRVRLADRIYAAVTDPSRYGDHRWRGVRTVPREATPRSTTDNR